MELIFYYVLIIIENNIISKFEKRPWTIQGTAKVRLSFVIWEIIRKYQ